MLAGVPLSLATQKPYAKQALDGSSESWEFLDLPDANPTYSWTNEDFIITSGISCW